MEDIFGSKGKVRILMAIAQDGEINITALVRRVGMDHTSVDGHWKTLGDADLNCEKRYG